LIELNTKHRKLHLKLSVTCFIDTAGTLVTPTCSVTSDNNIEDVEIKWRDSEIIEPGVRRRVGLRFIFNDADSDADCCFEWLSVNNQ